MDQVDRAVELIYLKYMKAKITYAGIHRIERYFIPEEALREALLNAICHKQYQSGIPIQIRVYEDQPCIANSGSLPEDWTMERFVGSHTSQPYNPAIAHVFYLAGFIESWGRGIEQICMACRNDGVDQPRFEIGQDDITICFTAPEDRIVRAAGKKDVTDNVTDNLDDVTELEHKILQQLAEGTCTTAELTERLKVSRMTVSRNTKSLVDKGLIKRVGSDRKGYWRQL